MRIEALRLRNYKVFRDVTIRDLPGFCVVVGANGTGKTTLFDVFAFLHDCLQGNVRQALDARGRFREVLSRNTDDATILVELQYRMAIVGVPRLVTYRLEIGERDGAPVVVREVLRYKRGRYGAPYHFLDFTCGTGYAISNEEDFNRPDEELDREQQQLSAPDMLALKGLGQFERFKAANALRQLIEAWHVSDFHLSAARGRKEASGESEHLSETGDNLPRVARHLHEQHPEVFREILDLMRRRVPGVSEIEPRLMDDGYLTLRFKDGSFQTPFLDRYVSDGTIKMLAYLVLLHDPRPHPLLCVEEPENQLYPRLMVELAEEFRDYANRGGQVLVSTHSPDFLNACALDEVLWLVKRGGYTEVRRARDDEQLATYMSDGDQMGYLWKQGFFAGADPAVKELVFLLEEASARAMLKGLLPRLLPDDVGVRLVVFEGKQDLERQLPRRLRGYRNPQARFIVLRDQDSHPDCKVLKARLVDLCIQGCRPDVVVRIACRELESFYLADLAAVEQGLGLPNLARHQKKRKYRSPDRLESPSGELSGLTQRRYQKVSGSRAIGPHLDLDSTRSASFRNLVAAIRRAAEQFANEASEAPPAPC